MANGYHLFSTGEVLTAANVNDYLMKQTVMIFASASARTTALSGVLREGMLSYRLDAHVLEVYNGTIWEAPETNLTTKGDLATFDTAPTRLAVGSDGQTLVANSANASGLGWNQNFAAGKNAVYNSATEIWQRGTTFTNTVGYTADRWYQAASNVTTTQETTIVPTGFVTSIKGTTTASSQPYWLQALETKDSIRFAGQTATISVYGATSDNSNMFIRLDYSTSTDNAAVGTWTTIATTNVSASSTIARLASASFAVPSTAKSLRIITGASGSIASGATVTFTGVQMEVGSVATAFARQSGSIQGELGACQRYAWAVPVGTNGSDIICQYYSTTLAVGTYKFPVTMRTSPTATFSAQNIVNVYVAGSTITTSALAQDATSQDFGSIDMTTTAKTAGFAASGRLASGSILWSAEL